MGDGSILERNLEVTEFNLMGPMEDLGLYPSPVLLPSLCGPQVFLSLKWRSLSPVCLTREVGLRSYVALFAHPQQAAQCCPD